MKTTVEFADPMLRKAKATAAHRGQSLKQYLNEALADKLAHDSGANGGEPAWMKFVGTVPRAESRRLMRVIDQEFGQIDPDDWT